MRPNYLTEYFPKYIAKHGMPKMRFHDLRHSCASLLLANGVPLKQIQEWLGHSDFSTTANIYAHLDYRSKISSAQAMEQGMLLPRSDDFGSRWENVTEQGKITEPDLNPRTLADQTISSVVRLWQIHDWSRSFRVTLLRAQKPRRCKGFRTFRPVSAGGDLKCPRVQIKLRSCVKSRRSCAFARSQARKQRPRQHR